MKRRTHSPRRRSRSPSPRYFRYPAGSQSRSPREPDIVPHDAFPRPPSRCMEPKYSSRSQSPARRSVPAVTSGFRCLSKSDCLEGLPTVTEVPDSESTSPVRHRSRSNSRSPIPHRGVRHYFTNRSRSSSPCRPARDYHADRLHEGWGQAWRRRATDSLRSPSPAQRLVHSMYHAASLEYEEVSPGGPRHRRPFTPPRKWTRSLSPGPPDGGARGGSPRIQLPVSVYHFGSRSPRSRSWSPVRIIRPPQVGAPHSTRSEWRKFEQLLQLHETTLQDYERRGAALACSSPPPSTGSRSASPS
ncbi:hypothetical protein LXA43DRAFT_102077 [Ganoderma leucocontextum]|nr:hypothetical protein LXA43DRAFT_102077 [Ganoderma leucocontextum]